MNVRRATSRENGKRQKPADLIASNYRWQKVQKDELFTLSLYIKNEHPDHQQHEKNVQQHDSKHSL